MSEKIIMSFQLAITNRWLSEVLNRLIPNNMDTIRSFKNVHDSQENELDLMAWAKVNNLRHYMMKDTSTSTSLFSRIRNAGNTADFKTVSALQLEMDEKMNELKNAYGEYRRNLLDLND